MDPVVERQMSSAAAGPSHASDVPDVGHLTQQEPQYGGLSFVSHMLAGAVAGVSEHVAMYPMDTIKTRMQALGHPGQRLRGSTVPRAVAAVIKREGIAGLYGGVGVTTWAAGPAHALYFATYELAKQGLGGNAAGHHPMATAVAGSVATIVNDGIMTPSDVVKQRLQVANSPYQGMVDCILRISREEGLATFFKSYRTTLVMNVPFTAIHFATYESCKKLLSLEEDESLAVQLPAGGVAGGVSAALTTPLDVVKTRLQLEGVNSATRYGTTAVGPMLRQIVREEGKRALWSGLKPRCLFHIPAAAICWGTYESMKSILGAQ